MSRKRIESISKSERYKIVGNFFGKELISYNGKEIYKARYIGGFVDLRREE